MTNIMNHRIDLSDWIIHFVHDRKSADDMYAMADLFKEENGEDIFLVSYFDKNRQPIDLSDKCLNGEYPIVEDEPAFGVLEKILHDGFIRSGWSYRNLIPTIYGPYSAVCFTEMPLYALIEYAKDRGAWSGYVGNYGIAFRKSELFQAGARQVIYGLSSLHKESDENDSYCGYGLRTLDSSCGIGLEEQYRYVYTRLGGSKPIDWTHEREWRWALKGGDAGIDGMAFLLSEDYGFQFSEIVVIVTSDEEQKDILEQLKMMYDSGTRECGIPYNKSLLQSIKVLSLESLSKANINRSSVRIEDIPYLQIPVKTNIVVSEEIRLKVVNAINKAHQVSNETVANYLKNNPDYRTPEFNYGTAYVYTTEVSEITQALLNEKLATFSGNGKYWLHLGNYIYDDIDLEEIGAKAAADFLSQDLGQSFFYYRQWD